MSSRPTTPSMVHARLPRISKILQETHKHSYTAPINSDSVTSIAYALTALGYPHDPDNCFYATKTNVADVTDEGLSLGQAYDAAMRVTSVANPTKGLPIRVEMHHFTEVGPSLEVFRATVKEAVVNGSAVIVQFDVAMAHFGPGVSSVCEETDEDSFALLADYDDEADEAIIVDPANHRWMKIWRCPLARLMKAMQMIDPRSNLPRGAICISRLDGPGWSLRPDTSVGRFTPSTIQLAHWKDKQDCDKSLHQCIPVVDDKYTNLNDAVTGIALTLNSQGYGPDRNNYDSIFHVTELAIAESQRTFPLQNAHATVTTYINRRELPLFVESFLGVSFSEKAFQDFCTDSTSRKDFWKYESILLCYDGNLLDMAGLGDSDGEKSGDAQYSMLVDEMDGVLIMASTVPKRRGRFWSCSVQTMFKGLCNGWAGVLRVCSNAKGPCAILGEPSFTMDSVPVEKYTGLSPIKGDTCRRKVCDCCWSLPEGLGASFKPQAQLLKEGFSMRSGRRTRSSKNLIADSSEKPLPYGVEPLEALSLALGSMGFPFPADVICSSSRVPLRDALAIRMTLAQLYDLSRAFLNRAGVPFRCEVIHFDDTTVDLASFKELLESASRPPFQDAFIFAFNVKMAYGDAAPAEFLELGRSQYAMFLSYDAGSGMVTLAETRPDDFGNERRVEVGKLFEAMRDKEGGHKALTKAGRRRGLLRIAMNSSKLFPDIPNVPELTVGRQETPAWDLKFWEIADLDHITFVQFQQPLNCCNNTALAYATSALGFPTTVDMVFSVVKPSIRSVTSIGLTLAETYEVAAQYFAKTGLPLRAEVVHFDKGAVSEDLFREELDRANGDADDVMICNFKVNIAHRAENIGGGHFALLGAYLKDTDEVLMADVNPMKYLRYWRCPLTCMYRAMCDPDSDSKRARGFMRIAKQSAPPMKTAGSAHISADLYQYMAAAHISSGLRMSRQD